MAAQCMKLSLASIHCRAQSRTAGIDGVSFFIPYRSDSTKVWSASAPPPQIMGIFKFDAAKFQILQ